MSPPMRGRKIFSVVFCLVALVAGSCAEGDPVEPGKDAESAAPADLMDEIETLCAPVADEHEELTDVEDAAGYRESAEALAEAEHELAESLRELDAPPEVEAYADALDDYAAAYEAAAEAESLDEVVTASRTGVELDEAARAAGLPDECPPPASVDVDNDLFVAKANRECFGLVEDAGGEPFDAPSTADEVALMIDLARRLTVGIAQAVRDSATPNVTGIPVKKIIRLNKKRFQAINALAGTFESGDYGEYRKAGRKLRKVSRKADREMASVGLFYCAKAFDVIPL